MGRVAGQGAVPSPELAPPVSALLPYTPRHSTPPAVHYTPIHFNNSNIPLKLSLTHGSKVSKTASQKVSVLAGTPTKAQSYRLHNFDF